MEEILGPYIARLLFIALSLFPVVSASLGLNIHSARRDPGRSYLEYIDERERAYLSGRAKSYAVDYAQKYKTAVLPPVVEWSSLADLNAAFSRMRDYRWIPDPNEKGFLRRSTWLYPDDGCFARAALANSNLKSWNYITPNKIFVFGNLTVRSDNAIGGAVSWWYHVAPIVQVQGQKFVLDPAIEPRFPLPLEDWLKTMSSRPGDLKVAVCASDTYTPYDDCVQPYVVTRQLAEIDQQYFLSEEWVRLLRLGREPLKELGDFPPWLAP